MTQPLEEELALLKSQLELTRRIECDSVAGVSAKYRAIARLELQIANVRARMELAAQ